MHPGTRPVGLEDMVRRFTMNTVEEIRMNGSSTIGRRYAHTSRIAIGVVTFVAVLVAGGLPAGAEEPLEYNRDIRPILANACFACHGPDQSK